MIGDLVEDGAEDGEVGGVPGGGDLARSERSDESFDACWRDRDGRRGSVGVWVYGSMGGGMRETFNIQHATLNAQGANFD